MGFCAGSEGKESACKNEGEGGERERDERPGKNLGAFESLLPDHSSSLTHLCNSVLGSHSKTLHLSY